MSSNNIEIPLEECKKYEGFLDKKSPALLKGFQKRYFRILDGKILVYSEKKDDKKLKGQVSFDQITSYPIETEKNIFKFSVLDGKDFILRAQNEETKKKWIYVLTKLIELNGGGNNNNNININNNKNENKLKLNKISAVTKSNISILKAHGFGASNDDNIEQEILYAKGINKIININDPKIKKRIFYGFLYKQSRSHEHFQKRFFFIFSQRPIFDKDYIEDEITLDNKKEKEWIEYDKLYYFKYEDKYKESEFIDKLNLLNCHKVEFIDKQNKFYLNVDVEDRQYEFYSETKGIRDMWYEVIKNSRRTAKECNNSVTKCPRNMEMLNNIYLKGEDKFYESLKKEKNEIIGNYDENINNNNSKDNNNNNNNEKDKDNNNNNNNDEIDFNIFEDMLNNFCNKIEITIDGCISCNPQKLELMQKYIDYNHNIIWNVVKRFWEKNHEKLENIQIIKFAIILFDYDNKLNKLKIIDTNFLKNAKELIKIYMKKTYKNILGVIENILKSERETQAIKDENGIYKTNGPNDLFNILSQTFDLIKDYKYKNIYEQCCNLYYESIIQYLLGVDCVVNNLDIIVENEYLIAIANKFIFDIKL